jgi:hypothetical protein
MNNSDMPAAPIGPYQYINEDGSFVNGGATGLTKREHFAGLAMQALVSHYGADGASDCAILACKYADALLKALETSHE